jgi:hypothetical protein
MSTIITAIQMQADEMYADTGNVRIETKSKNAHSRSSLVQGPPSAYHVPHYSSSTDHDKGFVFTATLRSLQELTQSPPLGSIVCPSHHFTPIYDKIVDISSENETKTEGAFTTYRKIPRIIHVSFNDRCVPNALAESITRWQETLPDHSIFFHDDKAVQRLIGFDNRNSQLWHLSEHFPELRSHLRCVKFKGAMLIDIWRMLVLWTYGGIYTDIDNWPGPQFNERTTIRDEDSFFSLSDGKERPTQWLFGMSPNHPIAIFTLQEISRRLLKVKNIARPRVVHITGPQAMKYGFRKFELLLEKNATVFGNSCYYTQVQKIDLAHSGQYALGNLGDTFDESVGHFFDESSNTTYTNITKRMKTELLSGVKHWTADVKLGQGKENATSKENAKDIGIGVRVDANTTGNKAYDEEDPALSYEGLSCTDYLATLG